MELRDTVDVEPDPTFEKESGVGGEMTLWMSSLTQL